MGFNYLKIALRFLLKNRTFTAINIFGLTIGFLCFMLITIYLHDEVIFDLFHKDADRIYRVLRHEKQEDGTIRNVAPVAARIGPEAIKQLPEVEQSSPRANILEMALCLANDTGQAFQEIVILLNLRLLV